MNTSPARLVSRRLAPGPLVATLAAALAACGGSDGPPSGPHAFGSVAITEAHGGATSTATGSVAAGFVPDVDGPGGPAAECSREVAGCQIALQPDCGGTCGVDEHCTFDDQCGSVCERNCDATCGPDEECYFPTPDEPACRSKTKFDAGAITVAGGTTPITLLPPYAFGGTDDGSLFADGAELTISAAGASVAGYTAFTEALTATRVVRSEPPLDSLGIDVLYGAGDIPVGWQPGDDDLEVTAAVVTTDGRSGSLRCPATDGDGHLDLPRAAIDAALDGGDLDELTIAIRRSRTKTLYDIATVGALDGQVVQPTGWLELSTTSAEAVTFAGCEAGESVCDGACVATATDPDNCGACDHACPGNDGCTSSTCYGPTSCNTCAGSASTGGGTCASAYAACTADTECNALRTCLASCTTTTCAQTCAQNHPTGQSLYTSWVNCVCDDACNVECLGVCS